jgi:hypothetical protein
MHREGEQGGKHPIEGRQRHGGVRVGAAGADAKLRLSRALTSES